MIHDFWAFLRRLGQAGLLKVEAIGRSGIYLMLAIFGRWFMTAELATQHLDH